MDPGVWSRITDIFDRTLECPPDERDSYVSRACAGDSVLLNQVLHLLDEFHRASNFLEDPLASPSPEHAVSPGDLLAGRYRIEAPIGRGGMGEVYRAHDEFVDEKVALKTLRRELGQNPPFLRRFRREVRTARKVTHPNVCRVFEVGVHVFDGGRPVHFFTMELLEGETLAARLHRSGAFSTSEASPLVVQMAEGLGAAHRAGVIHRDFKSANVMLCESRAVIMDFGLARFELGAALAETAGSITHNAEVAGTVAYMSPEQLGGGAVTAASDVYSFGVVIFEMLTGRLPFNDRHIIQSAMERAADTAPAVRAIAPEIDARWAAVVTGCLQRDPARRFPSAGHIAAQLRSGWRPPMAYWTRRQWITATAALGVTAAGVALVPFVLRFSEQTPVLPEGSQALLSPITNSTGDSQFDGITELFRNQIAQSVRLNLIDGRTLAGALSQMGRPETTTDPAVVREAAWRLNAGVSIFGAVSRVGPDYVLSVQLETRGSQPHNPRTKSLRSFAASDSVALMRSVREASLWVRQVVGESAATIASFDRLPSDTTTTSWEALSLYAQGQQFFMRNDLNPALDKFKEALEADPKFTLAALRRADLLVSQNKQLEGFAQWKSAMTLLRSRPVTRSEELYARGMYSLDTGDLEGADHYFRTWALEYPNDWRGSYYRMIPLCLNGHATQALQLLQRLQPAMPEYGDLYAQMIACHLVLGQTGEARALVPSVRRFSKFPERADLREAYICFREANPAGALDALRGVQRSKSYARGAIDAMLQEALLLIDAGYPEAAAANSERFLRAGSRDDTAPEQAVLRIAQAWGEMLSGQNVGAVAHARLAIESQYAGPLALALTGTIFARAGASSLVNDVLRECETLQEMPLFRWARHRIDGERARASGNLESAIVQLRSAAALEPALAHRQYLIDALPHDSSERLELCIKAVRNPWQNLRPPLMHHIGAMAIAVPTVRSAGADEPFAKKFAESSQRLSRMT